MADTAYASLVIPYTTAFASVVHSHMMQSGVYLALRSAISGDKSEETSNNVYKNPIKPRTGRKKLPGQNDTGHKGGYMEMSDTWLIWSNAMADIDVLGAVVTTNDSH
ncbi:hypothetical protein F4825DRAFT_448721 [Nemania diffusa]|nr:hypothetical protein F4825DRAFT_448721 [Nemania diffusa]